VLRIPALQSPNFVTGVSGWIVRRDGTVEFNNGTFRGSITSGPNPGQHIVINDPITGDAVVVYNAGNQIVYEITNTGVARSIDPTITGSPAVAMSSNQLTWTDPNSPGAAAGAAIRYTGYTSNVLVTGLILTDNAYSTAPQYQMGLLGGNANGTIRPTLTGTEGSVLGSMVQSDQLRTNNLIHQNEYVVTTNAAGVFTITHGASFTPTGGQITNSLSSGIATPLFLDLFDDKFTSTTCQGKGWNSAGAALNTVTIAVMLTLWG